MGRWSRVKAAAVALGSTLAFGQAAASQPTRTAPPAQGSPQPPAPAPPSSAPPPSTPPSPAQAEAARLEQARALFRSGVAMLNTGDYERALEYFLRSREAYPSPPNTINAALCLDRLGRYDESLELYETALATLGDKLDAQDSASISAATTQLLRKVARLDVSANVSGTVIVDGRARGKLPLGAPIRALAGTHVVRIVKDGYRSFETTVEVRPGETMRVDARLEPLESAGQLRIEDPGHDGADVVVDGAVVGQSPWEGTLGPGRHAVWSHAGEVGSAPTSVVVLQGQTALVRLRSGPLGPPMRVEVRPESATIELSGVLVARGHFEARLPAGDYQLAVKEPGYFPRVVPLNVEAAPGGSIVRVPVVLTVDPSDARWPRAAPLELGHFWVGLYGGVGWGPSMGSAAEAGCPQLCSGRPSALGIVGGARGGFRFRFGTSIELSFGYAQVDLSSDRTRAQSSPGVGTWTYAFHDDIRLAGPTIALGASHQVRLFDRVSLVPRLTVGALVGNVRDPVTGSASTAQGDSAALQIPGSGTLLGANRAMVIPELGATIPWRGFEVGLALQAAFFLGPSVNEPDGQRATIAPRADGTTGCTTAQPSAAACATSYSALGGERVLGAFWVLLPVLSVTRVF